MQIVLTFNRVVNNKVSILLFRMYIKCHAKLLSIHPLQDHCHVWRLLHRGA